jgi:hypothetical protein
MSSYVAWTRHAGGWSVVAEAGTLAEAHRLLLTWINDTKRVPVQSAVLPAGTHPEQRERTDNEESR